MEENQKIDWRAMFMEAADLLRDRQFDGEETTTGYNIFCRTCGDVQHPKGYIAHKENCRVQELIFILEEEEARE